MRVAEAGMDEFSVSHTARSVSGVTAGCFECKAVRAD